MACSFQPERIGGGLLSDGSALVVDSTSDSTLSATVCMAAPASPPADPIASPSPEVGPPPPPPPPPELAWPPWPPERAGWAPGPPPPDGGGGEGADAVEIPPEGPPPPRPAGGAAGDLERGLCPAGADGAGGDHRLVLVDVEHAEVNTNSPLLYWQREFGTHGTIAHAQEVRG